MNPLTVQSNLKKMSSNAPVNNPLAGSSLASNPLAISPAHCSGDYCHQMGVEDELTATFELINIVKQFQHNKRWTLLIAPPQIPDKTLLACCSVDHSKILIVHQKQVFDMFYTIQSALSHSTCAAVIAWCDKIEPQQLAVIDDLAAKNSCHFYQFGKQHKTQVEPQLILV